MGDSVKIACLIGSPKGLTGSNSVRYAKALAVRLEEADWSLEWLHLHRAVSSREGIDDLLAKAAASDLILFAAPLYVDGLPAPAIRAFELIADARTTVSANAARLGLAVLIHCGFVEPAQNATAIEMCRLFAATASLEWFGALAFGGGGIPSRRGALALRAAGDALAAGEPISEEVRRQAERPVMPGWLYLLGGNQMWRSQAKKRFGVSRKELLARPYERSQSS